MDRISRRQLILRCARGRGAGGVSTSAPGGAGRSRPRRGEPVRPPGATGRERPDAAAGVQLTRAGARAVAGQGLPVARLPRRAATFPTADGGWILVTNSESLSISGAGTSAIRFRPDGEIASAYRILAGTNVNRAGGGTPWGTWLSCAEHDAGLVWECD